VNVRVTGFTADPSLRSDIATGPTVTNAVGMVLRTTWISANAPFSVVMKPPGWFRITTPGATSSSRLYTLTAPAFIPL
jgi:hypothetical protein